MTYGQRRLVSNIGPDQSSALRPISIQTLTEMIISIKVTVRSAVLCMGTMDSCPVWQVTQANEPHANLCMLYTA
jgi:hypothetical protein